MNSTYVKKYNSKGDLINPITKAKPFIGNGSNRAQRRGRFTNLWNETLKRLKSYRLSSRGHWIMTGNPNAEHIAKEQMIKLQNN